MCNSEICNHNSIWKLVFLAFQRRNFFITVSYTSSSWVLSLSLSSLNRALVNSRALLARRSKELPIISRRKACELMDAPQGFLLLSIEAGTTSFDQPLAVLRQSTVPSYLPAGTFGAPFLFFKFKAGCIYNKRFIPWRQSIWIGFFKGACFAN